MPKIDGNFSWHGNQVVTAWSIATVLNMYVCDQLHTVVRVHSLVKNLYLDRCEIAAVIFSLT